MPTRRKFILASAVVSTTNIPFGYGFAGDSIATTPELCDILIIGAGGAGLAAAVAAAGSGASIVVLEKTEIVGGNTLRSSGAFNAAVSNSVLSKDTPEQHFIDTFIGGGCRGNKVLIRRLTEEAPATISWLKSIGVEFRETSYQAFGALAPRAHNTVHPFGRGYIEPLYKEAVKLGADIRLGCTVTQLHRDSVSSGAVVGVTYRDQSGNVRKLYARQATIVASGGFGANNALCAFYDPRLKNMNTTNHPGATGDLVPLLEDIGAALIGMDFIEQLPAAYSSGTAMGAISPVYNFIFVNGAGNRFVSEDATHALISDAIMTLPDRTAFSIMDRHGFESMKTDMQRVVTAGIKTGDTTRENSLEGLAIKLGIPVENLKRSVQSYNQKISPEERVLKHPITEAPFTAVRLGLAVHFTMGGVRINEEAQVIDRNGEIIPRLYAAGEVTGGVHGDNRLGGNALAEAFTFGRIAGVRASEEWPLA